MHKMAVLIYSLVTLKEVQSNTHTHTHTNVCRQNEAKVKSRVNLLRHNGHVSHSSKWSWKEATVWFAIEGRKNKRKVWKGSSAFTTKGGKHTQHFALSYQHTHTHVRQQRQLNACVCVCVRIVGTRNQRKWCLRIAPLVQERRSSSSSPSWVHSQIVWVSA